MKINIQYCRAFFQIDVRRRAFRIALVVGTFLNLINQGDALISFDHVNWVKIVLTYSVPYLVSSYSSAASRVENNISD